jgi:hypothetical protein
LAGCGKTLDELELSVFASLGAGACESWFSSVLGVVPGAGGGTSSSLARTARLPGFTLLGSDIAAQLNYAAGLFVLLCQLTRVTQFE